MPLDMMRSQKVLNNLKDHKVSLLDRLKRNMPNILMYMCLNYSVLRILSKTSYILARSALVVLFRACTTQLLACQTSDL